MKVIEHIDLLDKADIHIFWKGNKHYPPEHLSEQEKLLLQKVSAIQIIFEGAGSNKKAYDRLFNTCYRILKELLDINFSYLLLIESSIGVKNRIRSFKGILPKKELSPEDYYEQEFALTEDHSLIIGAVKLNEDNYYKVIRRLGDKRTAFVITSKKDALSQIFLKNMVDEFISFNSSFTTVNYLKLLTSCCSQGDVIYRIGGDGGDTSLSIDIFVKSSQREIAFKNTKTVINAMNGDGVLP